MEKIMATNTNENNTIRKGPLIGARHIQFLFLFAIGFLLYATRFGFSVSLVAMTQNYSSNPNIPYYNWTNKSFILSTFFWGYVLPQIPIGILGTKFGSKKFMLAAMFFNSFCMCSIPTVAKYFGSNGVMAFRIFQGFAQGLIVPSTHGIIGKWALPSERCRVYAFMSTGYFLGHAAGVGTTGYICESWGGWPLSFYLIPSLGFVWVILYFLFGGASPATHKTISDTEKRYLQEKIQSQDIYNVSIPYKSIFTSTPVWAQLTMALCSGWGFSMFTTEMPIYMDKIMKFNIGSNGLISALPALFGLLSTNIVAYVADMLIKKNIMTIGHIRKTMSTIGSLGCALLLIVFISLPTSSKSLCVIVLVASYAIRAFNLGGYNINHLDLAPNFAATLMGFVNTSAEIFSFITPMTVQYIVYDETDRSLWRIVFIIAICLYIFSTCFYITFASGEVQYWNYTEIIMDKEEDNVDYKNTDVEKPFLK